MNWEEDFAEWETRNGLKTGQRQKVVDRGASTATAR